ncbi:MAG: DUF1724 domain-containing protein [Methanobacterium sp.]|uniref:helix-turn-helix transcriptional regulator n=1 Tax=Methanobacterium sp. TaxID=2164 RepID=UPI003D650C10|nr:DUF1724 domain-containing protein [Methanobacterium sp.]
MDTKNILDVYESVKNDIKFITASAVRTKIILSLNKSDKCLNDFKNEMNLQSSSILRALKALENEDMVFKLEGRYFLSEFGRIIALKLENFFKSVHAITKCEKIWLDHCISGIPPFLIIKIGHLSNSFIVESTSTDIIKPQTYYAEILSKCNRIRAVNSIFYYPYLELYKERFKSEAEVEMILTPLILGVVNKTVSRDKLEKIISSNHFNLLEIDEDVNIKFTVTETFFSLGLFLNDGLYDATMNLVSYDRDAIKWGNELFDYYLKKSQNFNLDELENL